MAILDWPDAQADFLLSFLSEDFLWLSHPLIWS